MSKEKNTQREKMPKGKNIQKEKNAHRGKYPERTSEEYKGGVFCQQVVFVFVFVKLRMYLDLSKS